MGLTVDVEDARDYHEELVETGYKQIGDYLLYDDHGESQFEARVEEALVYDFEEPDRVIDLFSADELAEMCFFRTSFEEATNNLIEDENSAKIMEFEYLGTAFFNELNQEISCCETHGGGFFG